MRLVPEALRPYEPGAMKGKHSDLRFSSSCEMLADDEGVIFLCDREYTKVKKLVMQ